MNWKEKRKIKERRKGPPLYYAIEDGDLELCKQLIKKEACIGEYVPGLHWAVYHHQIEIAKFLIDLGADVNEQEDDLGMTPLQHALRGKDLELSQTLISKGADINATDYSGETALHQACFYGDTAIVRYLLQNGADIHARTKDGITPLLAACVCAAVGICPKELEPVVKELIELGASAEVNICTEKYGETPLMAAARGESLYIAELLLKAGAFLNAIDSKGQTPLHHAIRSKEREMVRFLISQGADVHIRDKNGVTPQELIDEGKHG